MKHILFALVLGYFSANPILAQQTPMAKIHILNTLIGQSFDLRTTADVRKPIQVKPRTWAIIHVPGDSVGFILGNKPYFVHVTPGRNYYFVAQVNYGTHTIVSEKTEMEFILTASDNNAKGPEEYTAIPISN